MSALFQGSGLTNSQVAVVIAKLKEQLDRIKSVFCWLLPMLPDAEFDLEGYSVKIKAGSITLMDYTLADCVLEYTVRKAPSSPTPP